MIEAYDEQFTQKRLLPSILQQPLFLAESASKTKSLQANYWDRGRPARNEREARTKILVLMLDTHLSRFLGFTENLQ